MANKKETNTSQSATIINNPQSEKLDRLQKEDYKKRGYVKGEKTFKAALAQYLVVKVERI